MTTLPMQNYRVVDFGWAVAAPMVGLSLADMGAEVIRVESRNRLDGLRLGQSMARQASGIENPDPALEQEMHPTFHIVNRGKRGITANIKEPGGVRLLRRLAQVSDVVVDNFSPGVLDRAALGYRDLRQERPDLVMLSMSSAGQYGPLRDVTTYAPTVASLAGLHGLVGYSEDRLLGMMDIGYGDANASLLGTFAVLACLRHRQRTGQGQFIDMSQWEATTVLLGEALMDYAMNGRVQRPTGNTRPGMAPYGIYPCKGEDQWVSIAVKTQEEWEALSRAMGDPAWAQDPRFADPYSRARHRETLDEHLATWTRERAPEQATALLQAHGVAAAPVLDMERINRDPHFRARQTFLEIEHPYLKQETAFGVAWKLSRTPGGAFRRAPFLGEHNDYVFQDVLGLSPSEVAQLKAAQALD